MDFILAQIRNHKRRNSRNLLGLLGSCRLEIEYIYYFVLGYLWNTKRASLDDPEKKRKVHEIILNPSKAPSVGSIAEACQILDHDKTFFTCRRAQVMRDEYPCLRNGLFGHPGQVSEIDAERNIKQIENHIKTLFDESTGGDDILSKTYDLVLVERRIDGVYEGVRYYVGRSGTGQYTYGDANWQSNDGTSSLDVGHVYATPQTELAYYKISPFIHLTSGFSPLFYEFSSVVDIRNGTLEYNQLLSPTENTPKRFVWKDEFTGPLSTTSSSQKYANGTITNKFSPNFKDYIELSSSEGSSSGLKKKIEGFLQGGDTCGVVYGYGGMGKTATVQSICKDYWESDERIFDYIVFASAKDQLLNWQSQKTEFVNEKDRINSYEGLIDLIHSTFREQSNSHVDKVKDISDNAKRLLIVIDDYETFLSKDRQQINDFISKLSSKKNQKVLITTRMRLSPSPGPEFFCGELNKEETIEFLRKATESLEGDRKAELEYVISKGSKPNADSIFEMTSGRPIFILMLANLFPQKGVEAALKFKLQEQESAIDFLFGRVFDCLTEKGKKLFCTISQLTAPNDLTNSKKKLRYIAGMEGRPEEFDEAIGELEGFKVIETSEREEDLLREEDLFQVYSSEIQEKMVNQWTRYEENKKSVGKRLAEVKKDKEIRIEEGMLLTANEKQDISESRGEIIESYEKILRRSECPDDIFAKAVINLARYYDRIGDKVLARRVFQENFSSNEEKLEGNATFFKEYASYFWKSEKQNDRLEALAKLNRIRTWRSKKPSRQSNPEYDLRAMDLKYQLKFQLDRLEHLNRTYRASDVDRSLGRILSERGQPFYEELKKSEMKGLKDEERQNVLCSLYYLVVTCQRLHEYDQAKEICLFGQNQADAQSQDNEIEMRNQFSNKLEEIEKDRESQAEANHHVGTNIAEKLRNLSR